MKKLLAFIAVGLLFIATVAEAGYSFRSSGASRSFSSSRSSSYSSPSRSSSYSYAPSRSSSSSSAAPARGFNSMSANRPAPTPTVSRPTTTTTTTTTVSRTRYQSRYINSEPVYYGGFGPGYHYTNGLVTGMIIGNMMHPNNTVIYTGPGPYANHTFLYPNGQVVNESGHVVGMYTGGSFSAVENGPMVAQPLPSDVVAQPVVVKEDHTVAIIFSLILGTIVIILFFRILFF